ncbi:unnamed protein product [Orchesella dallaii]|uniref:Uncharacterized protein n=1 Tax=Orchesella dallaii TaxID=48710 RepID=A0ABP1RLY6_9HEXA
MEIYKGTTWWETENIVLNYFRDLTVQFIWDQNTELALVLFARCIALQCILVNFQWNYFEKYARNVGPRKRDSQIQHTTLKLIFEANSIFISNPKYGNEDLLLISDSTFPASNPNQNVLLQIWFVESYQFAPIQIPTAVVLSDPKELEALVHPKDKLIMPVFSDAILLFVDILEDTVKIGCFTCEAIFQTWKHSPTRDTVYEVQFEPLWKHSLSSIEDLKRLRESLHSSLYFGPDEYKLKCPSFSSYEIEPGKLDGELCQTFKTYFKYSNCSEFRSCMEYHIDQVAYFVQSGLFELSIKNHRSLQKLRGLHEIKKLGILEKQIGNKSWFSYVFLAERKNEVENKERPTKLSALRGTFILVAVMMCIAAVTLTLEIYRPLMINSYKMFKSQWSLFLIRLASDD